ncbi:MAG: peptide deformylase [Candidatus Omnitrophica bacterium]|nr:peptide deformylase [Candidatus Omnitrophota bacterium]
MAILPIVQLGDPVLRKKAEPLSRITAAERKLIQDMIDTMYFAEGVGLAANQVGVSQQIIIISPTYRRGAETVIINPQILKQKGRTTDREGCLSVPGFSAKVTRSDYVQLKGLTVDGEAKVWELKGFAAVIVQHEVDHLNGYLFIDRLKFLEKRRVEKWLREREQALGHS